MATARKYGSDGKEMGTVDLPAPIFEAEINQHLLWESTKIYLGNQRQGNAATKTRAMVSGGGRKPWKQKGTGRARAGSNTSPLWPGGGVTFGPHPRDYTARMNQKARTQALLGALSARAKEGGVVILDPPVLEKPRTKVLAELIEKVGLAGKKVLWIFERTGEVTLKSARNLDRVRTAESRNVNAYALLNCDCVVLTEGALKTLTERLTP